MMTKVNGMKPQDALNLLKQVSAQLPVIGEVHEKIKEAARTLQTIIDTSAVSPDVQDDK